MDTIWQPDLSKTGRSKYLALADALRKGIADKALMPGQKLPPVRDLAYRVGVTPGTAARAYSILISEGRLVAGVGRGTYVADEKPKRAKPADWPERVYLRSPVLPDAGQVEITRDAMHRVADRGDVVDLTAYPNREGNQELRSTLRRLLADLPVGNFDVDDIVLTHGAQSAIIAVLQTVLRGPDPVVLIEAQAYPGFRRAADLCRARVITIDCDEDGPIVHQIESAAREFGAQVFLTSSEVNNPTLRRTTPERRYQIARVARRYGMNIVDDDCYKVTPASAESYRALLPDLGWYVSSLSKSFSPALRVGWAIAPSGQASDLARTVAFSCFGLSRILTDTTLEILNDKRLDSTLSETRATIASKVRQAVNHLGGHDVKWHEDVPFLWISLPRGWRASRFVRVAEAQGVILKSSEEFVARDARAPHCVRLAVNSQIAAECFENAVDKVRTILDNPQEEIGV